MNEAQIFIDNLSLPSTSSNSPSVYAFSLHKSGSTLLFNMLREISTYTDLAYFSMQDQLFATGTPNDVTIPQTDRFFKERGYIYGGFRFLPTNYEIPNLANHKKILLVRNPLDVLVSMYFSRRSSHIIPKKGRLRELWKKKREETRNIDINEFALAQAPKQLKRMQSYQTLLSDRNTRLYRYEDMIYEKKEFIHDVLDFFDIVIPEGKIERVISKNDVFPDGENESKHIRQVHPGNYKKHLDKPTINALRKQFETMLIAFGYLPSAEYANIILNSIAGVQE